MGMGSSPTQVSRQPCEKDQNARTSPSNASTSATPLRATSSRGRHRAEGPALTINPEERPPTSEELLSKIRPPTNFVCGVEEPYQLEVTGERVVLVDATPSILFDQMPAMVLSMVELQVRVNKNETTIELN